MITVRAMQVKDAEQVSELEKMIFSQPWSYQGFVDSLSLPNTVFLVAEENNKILGYIGMYLSIDEGESTNVAVHRKCGAMALAACCLRKQKKRQRAARSAESCSKSVVRMTVQSVCMSAMDL